MLIALAYILRHVTTDGRLRSFNGQIQMTSALFPYKSTFKNRPHVKVYLFGEGYKNFRNLHLTFDCMHCGKS